MEDQTAEINKLTEELIKTKYKCYQAYLSLLDDEFIAYEYSDRIGNEDNHLKKIEAIIFSMTQEERRNPDMVNGSRRKRVARGSGTTVRDVNQLLNQFYQMKKMTKMISKGKMPGNIMNMLR